MAIGKNDLNFLNKVSIKAVNNRKFYDDVRSSLIITREFDFNPTVINSPMDILKMSLGEEETVKKSKLYGMVMSAFSQKLSPVKLVIYGNKALTSFDKIFEAYKDNSGAIEVSNIAIIQDGDMSYELPSRQKTAERVFFDTIRTTAIANKDKMFYVGINKSEQPKVEDIVKLQQETNVENLAIFVEGQNNVVEGRYITGAILGGVVGAKEVGRYIVHASEIVGFVGEDYTATEQTKLKEAGLNFLSKPTKGYMCLINGLASDNKMYIDLKLGQLWLADTLTKELTILQITEDKLPFKEDKGVEYVRTVILNVVKKGASDGIFLTDSSKDVFGTRTTTDRDGNKIEIKLGYLDLEPLTQENIREGLLNFNLMVTYDVGVRHVTLNGTITTEGKLIVK